MFEKSILKCVGVALALSSITVIQARPSDAEIERSIKNLLGKMTLEEKVGHLQQPYLSPELCDSVIGNVALGRVGSVLLTKNHRISPEERNEIQRKAVEESRLGIPVFFGYDVIHGFKTLFPTPLALSSSWDDELMEECAAIAADESSHWGIDMAFSPMLDVCRDPRWGRISECSGEDVLINSRMGVAAVKGYQGDDYSADDKVAACLKHFVGYGVSVGGRDKSFSEISERTLHDTYLPPFKACVEAGAPSVMVAFNDLAGVPMSANHHALSEILKDDWGFDGIALSDWDAILELSVHGVTADEKESAMRALNAGMDVEMKSYCFDNLGDLVKEKKVSMKRLDDAVARVLRLKYRMGLFDNPYIDASIAESKQLTAESRAYARKAAAESMILLKNNGILPIDASKVTSGQISIVGQMAHNHDLMGGWIGMGEESDVIPLFDGITAGAPDGVRVIDGSERMMQNPVTIVCVGERSREFGESHDLHDIELSPSQVALVKEAKSYSAKVVVVVCSGRPLVLTPIMPYADAIVQAWHLGTEAGNAVADVIFGRVNPSGKTTCSMLKATGQVPVFYCDRLSGRPRVNRYVTIDAKPLFPFGYGLSYTTFEYSNFRLSKSEISKDGELEATVTITNTGDVTGKEIAQLYMHDRVATYSVPKKLLIDYKKVEIKPNESIEVTFEIKAEQLSLLDQNYKPIVEPGEFDIWVGGDSESLLGELLTVK